MLSPQFVIVDNDEDVRQVVRALAQEGFPSAHITEYASGLDALEHIRSRPADLLITNCEMPDMDGLTLVRTLREDHFSLPIIMVSGSPGARDLGERAGVDQFVEKGHMTTRLVNVVSSLIAG
jgi:CheY-like chemotaxis protein